MQNFLFWVSRERRTKDIHFQLVLDWLQTLSQYISEGSTGVNLAVLMVGLAGN